MITKYNNPYTAPEQHIIKMGWEDGLSDQEIQELLKGSGFQRTILSIKAHRCRIMRLCGGHGGWNRRKDVTTPLAATTQTCKLVSADLAFKRAMLGAIKNGTETAVLGVVKDRRPWALKKMQPEPIMSGCSSPESWV